MVLVGCESLHVTTTTTTLASSLVSWPSKAGALSSSARRDELWYCGVQRLRWGPGEARRGGSWLRRAGAWRWGDDDDDEEEEKGQQQQEEKRPLGGFEEGVRLFNQGRFYECHDVLERMWYTSPEPRRSVLHGILQCSVGLHHLLNRNHKGAMAELGEGLAKLRRQRFNEGPFQQFQQEMAAVLQYIYDTQLEYAACELPLPYVKDVGNVYLNLESWKTFMKT